jgi:hypothetical protein
MNAGGAVVYECCAGRARADDPKDLDALIAYVKQQVCKGVLVGGSRLNMHACTYTHACTRINVRLPSRRCCHPLPCSIEGSGLGLILMHTCVHVHRNTLSRGHSFTRTLTTQKVGATVTLLWFTSASDVTLLVWCTAPHATGLTGTHDPELSSTHEPELTLSHPTRSLPSKASSCCPTTCWAGEW